MKEKILNIVKGKLEEDGLEKVKIVKHDFDLIELNDYFQKISDIKKGGDPAGPSPSFVEYVKRLPQYKDQQNIIIVPSFSLKSGHTTIDQRNLAGLDFSGCDLSGVEFDDCDLQGAIFTDCDLSNVIFTDCNLQGADLRGSDISGTKLFGYNNSLQKLQNIKISSTDKLLRSYLAENASVIDKENKALEAKFEENKQKELEKLEEKKNKAYKKLTWAQTAKAAFAENTGNDKYDKIVEDIQKKKNETFPYKNKVSYYVDPSFNQILINNPSYDPAYVRGSGAASQNQYVKLTKSDLETYLKLIKGNENISLNEYAARLIKESGVVLQKGHKIVADLIGQDLSGLDFSGADLREACFAGAKLKGCKFDNANLSKASFEGADLEGVSFKNVNARDMNLYHAKLDGSEINKSIFKRAYLKVSSAVKAKISDSNFEYADIRRGKWDGVKIDQAQFKHADMQGVSLALAELHKVEMQHAILNKAYMDGCKIIESDLQDAFMQEAKLVGAKIQNTLMKDIEAQGINLSQAELDALVKLDGANLQNAIMERINAEKVSFVSANMNKIQAEYANFKAANIEKAKLLFAELDNAILTNAKAKGVDISGAKMNDIQAQGADFSNAIAQKIEAEAANFSNAKFTEADLQGANLQKAILEQVNMQKAKLQGGNFEKAFMKKADLNEAEVDALIKMKDVNLDDVKGKVNFRNAEGVVEKIDIKEAAERAKQAQEYVEKSALSRWASNAFKGAKEKIKDPLGPGSGEPAYLGFIYFGILVLHQPKNISMDFY